MDVTNMFDNEIKNCLDNMNIWANVGAKLSKIKLNMTSVQNVDTFQKFSEFIQWYEKYNNTVQHSTLLQSNTVPSNLPYNTLQSNTLQSNTVQSNPLQSNTVNIDDIDAYLMQQLGNDEPQYPRTLDDALAGISNVRDRQEMKNDILARTNNVEQQLLLAELSVGDYHYDKDTHELNNRINNVRNSNNGRALVNMQIEDDLFNLDELQPAKLQRSDNLAKRANTPRPDTPRPTTTVHNTPRPTTTVHNTPRPTTTVHNTPRPDTGHNPLTQTNTNPSQTGPVKFNMKPIYSDDLVKLTNVKKIAEAAAKAAAAVKNDGPPKVVFKTPNNDPPVIDVFLSMSFAQREELLEQMYMKAKKNVLAEYGADANLSNEEINKKIRVEMDRLVDLYRNTN